MKECDLILKGGVTSSVVYPYAVMEIAKEYRLRNVGGTSSGAIAAVLAAAAEYRRCAGGGDPNAFDNVEATAETLKNDLASMFQPTPKTRPIFDILRFVVDGKGNLREAVCYVYRRPLITIFCLTVLACCWLAYLDLPFLATFVAAAGVATGFGWVSISLYLQVAQHLPSANFGLCPGVQQPGYMKPAFTDWIADEIDRIATGHETLLGAPLTSGQLGDHNIHVATMTTDLTEQRPYRLPFQEPGFYVRKSEIEQYFPRRIVDHICDPEKRLSEGVCDIDSMETIGDLYPLPIGDDFPVVMMARLSLSFPGFISSVPLWRETQAPSDCKLPAYRKHLFSDGGISSNFPIHFFDAILPSRPTFGISVADFDPVLHGEERVGFLSAQPGPVLRSAQVPKTVFGFLYAILNAAKDWRDTLQSQLPGYADRVIEIRLKPDEGGFNLAMPTKTIKDLQDLGREAGEKLVTSFSTEIDPPFTGFDRHKFLRADVAVEALQDMLDDLHAAYGSASQNDYPHILANLLTSAANMPDATERKKMIKLLSDLSTFGTPPANPPKSRRLRAAELRLSANTKG